MIDNTAECCRARSEALRRLSSAGCELLTLAEMGRTADLLQKAANRLDVLKEANGKLREQVERLNARKRRGQRTSRGSE